MMQMAKVYVKYKKGIIDPEAQNVKKALEMLGYNIKDVKIWEVYEIKTNDNIKEIIERLLVNPVINEYKIE